MEALVITGVGNNYPNYIVSRLVALGYRVSVKSYAQLSRYEGDYDLVVGHSAGAARAVDQYGGSDTRVIALGSPHRPKYDNVGYYQNAADPVGFLAMVLDPFSDNSGGFVSFTTDVHSKNDAWDKAEAEEFGG